MTVVVAIEPIDTETANGTQARVTGIDMTSGDPFRGTVEYEPGQHRPARWRVNGMIRDGHPGWNLALDRPELEHLYSVATKLGARLM